MRKRKLSPKAKRSIRTVNYGLAGSIAGTAVGFKVGGPKGSRTGSHIGAGLGIATGTALEKRFGRSVPEQKESVGDGKFQSRVGTKTNGRVKKKDNPYIAKGGK